MTTLIEPHITAGHSARQPCAAAIGGRGRTGETPDVQYPQGFRYELPGGFLRKLSI